MSGVAPRKWKCPFFIRGESKKVYCVGCSCRFSDAAAYDDYISRHCASDEWSSCTVAQNRIAYYDIEHEREI